MIALLFFATAAALLFLAQRFVAPVSRAAMIALVLMPLVFTGRAVFTGGVYAPVELPYDVPPLADVRAELGVGPARNPMLTDIAFILIPWREAVRRAVADGEWPLLNRFELCGEPLAAAMQPAVYSPFTWIALLLPTAMSFTYTASVAFFLAALGMFLFLRDLGRSELAALVAAAIFMFSAPMALQILWPLGFAWALAPLLLLAMRRAATTGKPALLTAAFALMIVAGHPETLLHTVAIASVYGLFLLRSWRGAAAVVVAGVLALALTAVALLPFFEAAPYAGEHRVRSEMYAKSPLKVAPGVVKAALTADLFPFQRTQPYLPRAEAGSLALALACTALIRVRSREVWFFAALAVFAVMAGANAWPVAQLLHKLPMFSVAINDRLVSLVPLCLAVLAAFGIDAGGWRWAPIVLFVILGAGAWVGGAPDRVKLIAELAPLAVLPFARARFVLPLVLVQRVVADGALVPTHRPAVAYPPLALFEPLQSVREPFRIAAPTVTLVPDVATMYGLEDVRGATAMTFAPLGSDIFQPLWPVTDLAHPELAMMNVRFAVIGAGDALPAGWREVKTDRQSKLIENERVLPRAFLPRRVRGDANVAAEMKTATDFADLAWIEGAGEGANGAGTVAVAREGTRLRLDANLESGAWVVVTQTAWPGWRAYLDGRRVRTFRANAAFLAVYVPAGRHEVRLRYLPQSFVTGRTISVAVALLILAFLFTRRLRVNWPSRA